MSAAVLGATSSPYYPFHSLPHEVWRWWFFFFSSRRRHTRLQGDWSSDVCSSDLTTCAVRGTPRASEERRCGHDHAQRRAAVPLQLDLVELGIGGRQHDVHQIALEDRKSVV